MSTNSSEATELSPLGYRGHVSYWAAPAYLLGACWGGLGRLFAWVPLSGLEASERLLEAVGKRLTSGRAGNWWAGEVGGGGGT